MSTYEIKPTDADHAIKHDEAFILDIREEYELERSKLNIPFLHIPMGELITRLNELPTNKKVLVLCHHGSRSLQVTLYLKQQGHDALSIHGGIEAWSHQVDNSIPLY